MEVRDHRVAQLPSEVSVLLQTNQRVENSVPPTCIAVLVAAQHLQPFQPLPLLFVPAFIFSSYTNVAGHKVDAAGTSAAWSGLYMLLALRRKQVGGRARHLRALQMLTTAGFAK